MVQTSERLVSTDAERYLLVYSIGIIVIITFLVIVFFIVFQKRKNKILIDKFKQQQQFEEELAKTQLEIQEQTLKNVGRELHDNIGQMLAYANMQLNALAATTEDTIKAKVDDVKSVVKNSIEEVRVLSRTLNSDVSLNMGLVASLKNEVDRINNLKELQAHLELIGEKRDFSNTNDEIFIYRIVQEFLSNTMKYANAKTVNVKLVYSEIDLKIEVDDDGKGFDINTIEKGSGLINMKNRAELINADFSLSSEVGKGTELKLIYKF